MNNHVTLIKETIKKRIFESGWILRQLRGLSAGTELSYDLFSRLSADELEIIFDCGAHKGETAIDFKNRFPLAQIHSFEPIKKSFDELVKSTSVYPQIHCYNFALGDNEETIQIQIQQDSQTNSLRKSVTDNNLSNTESIKVQTIDKFMESQNLYSIDLLKIDTEGFEIQVLKGAKNKLENGKIKFVLAEATLQEDDSEHTNLNNIIDYLKLYNFKLVAIYDQVIWKSPSRLAYFNALLARS